MKSICFLLFLLMLTGKGWSQQTTSYIYLEGIPSLPFDLNLNGQSIPSSNPYYYLIPVEQTGENTLLLNFQQNEYPRQTFVLYLNEQSAYAYKLAKNETNNFYLIDLINEGKIVEGNSWVHTGISTPDNRVHFQNTLLQESKKGEKAVSKKTTTATTPLVTELKETGSSSVTKVEKWNSIKTERKETRVNTPEEKKTDNNRKSDPSIVSASSKTTSKKMFVSNCTYDATDKEVKTIIDKMSYKSKDEDKFILLKKKIFSGCLSTSQTALLLSAFHGQPTRLDVLRFLRPGIADVSDLISLQYLFKSASYREKVEALMYE